MSQSIPEIRFDPVEEAIAEIAAGRAVVVTDDEDRENEGDLIFAASKATPEIVNFLILHGRGLICVPCTGHHLHRLGLGPMVQANRESHRTDFTVSVDAAEGVTTGISAYDRSRAIQLLAKPETRPDELVQPGHVFPLRAKDGGVLERAGHTEAAVDLAALAGLFPCGVLCEILNEDGTMSRLPQLDVFRKRFGLKMISIASLIEYRIRREKLVNVVREQPFESEYGDFTLKVFKSAVDGLEHFALVKGAITEAPTLVRVHAENVFADLFHTKGSRGGEGLSKSLRMISEAGSGAVVYISRRDSGWSLSNLASEASSSSGKGMGLREYGVGAQVLVALGLKRIRLLTHSTRNVVALEGYGLEIVESVSI